MIQASKVKKEKFVSTTNACKLCKPLGASLAFRGVEGAVPYLHGSQGCATYMRRYIISHYREPMDIASSSLSEKHAVFGGGPNLKKGMLTVMQKYGAKLVGVASTCLTETIGDDMPGIVREFKNEFADLGLPDIVTVSTPSYSGTHAEGFHAAVKAMAEQLTSPGDPVEAVNLMPGFVSPADIRYLAEVFDDFCLPVTILPDISETLDGPALDEYQKIPEGGTPIAAIKAMGRGPATIECGRTLFGTASAGSVLEDRFKVPLFRRGLPIGLRESDAFFEVLEKLAGAGMPRRHELERGRLIDAFVDGHKYLFGKRVLVYGEEDLVIGLTSFLTEIGMVPVLAASGGNSGKLEEGIKAVTDGILREAPLAVADADFHEIADLAKELSPDMIVGNSKGYRMARDLGIPLVRVGFPIHDRFGGQRILHLGYRGALTLLDTVVNALLDKKQSDSKIGYGYI